MKILLLALLLTSCVSTKYVVTPMVMTVKNGHASFQPTGKTTQLQDTTVSILLIHKQ